MIFSDLSSPIVDFPGGRWRKFLPTDPTPAHWYTGPEFARLAHLIAAAAPDTAVGAFVRQFKGMSRCWRAVIKECPARTLGELVADSARIAGLHRTMKDADAAPKPEVLGRVGLEHFRQRFDARHGIISGRYWYKHRWGEVGGMPYLIEVAVAETERPGAISFGLNYSVPFADPLATTSLFHYDGPESVETFGLSAFMEKCGVYSGIRYGMTRNTAAAVHLVMPILPALDRGKSRLGVPGPLGKIIAEVVYDAAKILHKETIARRKSQAKRERQLNENAWRRVEQGSKLMARLEREEEERRAKEKKSREREERRAANAELVAQRKARGELPTIEEAIFGLILPIYLDQTENEKIRVFSRDLYYVTRPEFLKIEVQSGADELNYDYFKACLKKYRADPSRNKLEMLDFKARGTLHEPRTGRQIPIGDRELRSYRLPVDEYGGILVIEKEGVFETLKDTGGTELLDKWGLMVAANSGYAVDALRKLLFPAQRDFGWKVLVWHDADPAGHNICRKIAEPPSHLADFPLDVIDIGLKLEEGLAMGLQTETFIRRKAMPSGILPLLTETERRLFEGEAFFNEQTEKLEWRNCQRIEINAIPIRQRVDWLESKFSELLPSEAGEGVRPEQPGSSPRPDAATLAATVKAMVERAMRTEVFDLAERLAEAALKALPPLVIDTAELQIQLDAEPAAPWRERVRQHVAAKLSEGKAGRTRDTLDLIGQLVAGVAP